MRKLCFIICYFGNLPNTMQLTLNTCKYNPAFDWLLFTDDQTKYDYPENFHVNYCTFESIVDRIQKYFDFRIAIKKPYKLCDFKPIYGMVFEEELKSYKYWGYCDLDQLFGELSIFLTDEYLEKYDKIFTLGHMTIFKNNELCKTLFKLNDDTYKEVFSSEKLFGYDEWRFLEGGESINTIAEKNNLDICGDSFMLDVIPHEEVFLADVFDIKTHKYNVNKNGKFVAVWNNGKLYADFLGGVECESLYIHLQKRHMKIYYKGKQNTMLFYPNTIEVGGKITYIKIKETFLKNKIRCGIVKLKRLFQGDYT